MASEYCANLEGRSYPVTISLPVGLVFPRIGGMLSAVTGFLVPHDTHDLAVVIGNSVVACYDRAHCVPATVNNEVVYRWTPFEPMLPLIPLVFNNIKLISDDKLLRTIWVEGLYTPPDNAQYKTVDGVAGMFLPYSDAPIQVLEIGLPHRDACNFVIASGTGSVRPRPPAA